MDPDRFTVRCIGELRVPASSTRKLSIAVCFMEWTYPNTGAQIRIVYWWSVLSGTRPGKVYGIKDKKCALRVSNNAGRLHQEATHGEKRNSLPIRMNSRISSTTIPGNGTPRKMTMVLCTPALLWYKNKPGILETGPPRQDFLFWDPGDGSANARNQWKWMREARNDQKSNNRTGKVCSLSKQVFPPPSTLLYGSANAKD